MDEGFEQGLGPASIGERLRLAREDRGMTLDEVANQTRIPIRHLQHIEQEEWDALPGVTYCVGFTRAYANIIGLDGAELGRELRDRLGGTMTRAPAPQYYEPADPSRVPPRWIAIAAALIAVLLVIGYLVWRSSAVDDDSPADVAITQAEEPAANQAAARPAQPAAPAPVPANGPVVLTATEDVWLRIDQAGGGAPLYMGTLTGGQSYQVPAGAQSPRIRTARANALRVTVGGVQVPPLGPPETTISNVSLTPADLVARAQGGGAPPAAPPAATP